MTPLPSFCSIHRSNHAAGSSCPLCRAALHAAPADSVQVGGSHYKDMPMQPWDVMQAVLTKDEFIGFLKGNVLKYSLRAGKKAGADDDAAKAQHYAQKLREVQA